MDDKEKTHIENSKKSIIAIAGLIRYFGEGVKKIDLCMKECPPEIQEHLKLVCLEAVGILTSITEAVRIWDRGTQASE